MNRASWSSLPPDLLRSIAERLETRIHIMQFRSVCQTWWKSVPVSLFTAKNALSPLFPYKGTSHSSVLVASCLYLLRSAVNPELQPWLFTAEELNPGKLLVREPLSRVVTKDLPVRFPHLNTYDFDIKEVGRFYTLRRVDRPQDMFSEKRLTEYDNKVVLFVNPNCETFPTIDDCTVIELYDHVSYLSTTRLKNGVRQQVCFREREFDDLVNFKGRIFAVDYEGRAYSMDYHSLKMYFVTGYPRGYDLRSNYKKRLAVSCGELYLVYRKCQKDECDAAFEVFKLNEEKQKWDKVEGIGDNRILFVTFDGCFFASAKDFPGWKGNCIVFRRGSFPEYSGIRNFDCKIFQTWNIHLDVAVFHFENGVCGSVKTFPGYSAVIWPPPPWLWDR